MVASSLREPIPGSRSEGLNAGIVVATRLGECRDVAYLYNGEYGSLEISAAAGPAKGVGLDAGGAERFDDCSRVHRHVLCKQHQPMALPAVGSALWTDQPGPLGGGTSSHPQDRPLRWLRARQCRFFLQLAADSSPDGRQTLDFVAASLGSSGALHPVHRQSR
jgi:hypothetical protein